MSASIFIQRQITEIRAGGHPVVARKFKQAFRVLPLWILAVPVVIVIRLIRPWFLIRWSALHSPRIGHFAANTEMYICERNAGINVPSRRYVDLFYIDESICNGQLATMWARVLRIWPAWVLGPISQVNRLIPGGRIHEVSLINTQHDRDVHNLRDRFPPLVQFTAAERARGEASLREMGIPSGAPFVCLSVRDSAYLDVHTPAGVWNYHNYRDSDIQNYVVAAEALANRGYFVIRMGAKVRESIKSNHPKIIDYACNGMRTDFMDIFLCAKCEFMISTGEGLVCVTQLFRRPVVVVNFQPLAYWYTYYSNLIGITKHHCSVADSKELTLSEIFTRGVGFCLATADYQSKGVQLAENTPEEIRDVCVEMTERLNGTWQSIEDDESLQKRFWEVFPTNAVDAYHGRPLHGEIRARFGAAFLRSNRAWLQ